MVNGTDLAIILHTPEGVMDYCQGLRERYTDTMQNGFEEKRIGTCFMFPVDVFN